MSAAFIPKLKGGNLKLLDVVADAQRGLNMTAETVLCMKLTAFTLRQLYDVKDSLTRLLSKLSHISGNIQASVLPLRAVMSLLRVV